VPAAEEILGEQPVTGQRPRVLRHLIVERPTDVLAKAQVQVQHVGRYAETPQ
jgi:hypothetical protein